MIASAGYRIPVDWHALLTDIANVRAHAPMFVAALESHFDALLKSRVDWLDKPTSTSVSKLTDGEVRYALGLKEGLLRGRLVIDALEQIARRSIEQEREREREAQQRHGVSDAAGAAGVGVGGIVPAAGRPAHAVPRSGASAAGGDGPVGGLPAWVSTGGSGRRG